MKTIETKIQNIEVLYSRIEGLDESMDSIARCSTIEERDKWLALYEERRFLERRVIASVKNLVKNFGLELTAYATTSIAGYSANYKDVFYELKSRWERAKEILSGYDRYSCYTRPVQTA
jgi:hypothetical protein